MNDELESRLARLRPRVLSPSLAEGIAIELERQPAPEGRDRFFWCAVAGGAMAACVIVAVLLDEPFGPRTIGPALVDRNPFTALARADRRWGDELKLASDWSQP